MFDETLANRGKNDEGQSRQGVFSGTDCAPPWHTSPARSSVRRSTRPRDTHRAGPSGEANDLDARIGTTFRRVEADGWKPSSGGLTV